MINSKKYLPAVAIVFFVLLILSGCAGGQNDQAEGIEENNVNRFNFLGDQPFSQQTLNAGSESTEIPIVQQNGHSYVSFEQLMEVLNFNYTWDESTQSYQIGDRDVVYEIQVGTLRGKKEESDVQFSEKTIRTQDGNVLIPIEIIDTLFNEDMNYAIQNDKFVVIANLGQGAGVDLDFADDPEDPALQEDASEENVPDIGDQVGPEILTVQDQMLTAQAIKNINVNRMIATGKKYLGVDYKFGARRYAVSKRFDCSSFIQQLYGTYGVKLPRTARAQSKYGVSVSRKNLRKGDLLYFYVPGRFRTNKTVGHVGIYIGGGKMLHSSPMPKNGVQITNINKEYWKETYLGAKRVVR